MKDNFLTTDRGVPVIDNQDSLTAGQRGSVFLQDVQFILKIAHLSGNASRSVSYTQEWAYATTVFVECQDERRAFHPKSGKAAVHHHIRKKVKHYDDAV
jgi:hypothetical protein